MTSVISAANHALFAGSRLLYTLGVDGYAPRFFSHLNRFQVPWVAVLATSVISGLCFGASYIGAGQLWSWLQKYATSSFPIHKNTNKQQHRRRLQPTLLDLHRSRFPPLPRCNPQKRNGAPPPFQKLDVPCRSDYRNRTKHRPRPRARLGMF